MRKEAFLLGLVILANNNLQTYYDLFKSAGPKLGSGQSISNEVPAIADSKLTWLVPPKYHPGWLENDFLDQKGLQPGSILEYPKGIDPEIRAVTLNHSIIKDIVTRKIQSLIADHYNPATQPALLGDFLQSFYDDFQNRIVFPENYSEEEKTQALLDLTFTAAASVTNQYWTTYDATSLLGIELPDGYYEMDKPISLVYLDRQPRLFAAPAESCLDLLGDLLWRCYGPDRSQHVNAHRKLSRQFGAYLETRNPKLIESNVEVGKKVMQFIADLPIPKNNKLELLSHVVGLSWEAEETASRLRHDVRDLSPLETLVNPLRTNLLILRAIVDSFFTGYGDLNVTMDLLANGEGVRETEIASTLKTDSGARKFFESLNGPLLNGKIPVYEKTDPRVLIFQNFQKPIIYLNELTQRVEIPSVTNQAFIERAVEIGKKLERLNLTK
ncbi:hypothetical protein HY440_03060 [Candidatus Microgenomates bacterium]|nr:hypothetical protein [Candidatus Microgenomates bacterium]